jgi:adenine-specific DNA glycosylase
MPPTNKTKKPDLAVRLLAWYDVHRRVLPWRAPKGKRADPYRIWLSEIMLQQTTVQAVGPYYRKFLALWPDVEALAAAKQDDVLAAWAGLGYYARARNLHAAAKVVAHEMGGKFPATAEGLRLLPGIGGYTAGAIAAIAYDEKQAAMDANAERVIARLYAVQTAMPKMARPLKRGAAFVVRDRSGAVLLVKRPDKGLLASMLEPPLGPWEKNFPSSAKAIKQAPFEAAWKKCPGIVRHGFTHFELEIEVYVAEVVKRPTHICHPRPSAAKAARGEGDPGRQKRRGLESLGSLPSARETRASPGMTRWVKADELHKVALPTVMRKIVEHGLDEGGPLFALRKP